MRHEDSPNHDYVFRTALALAKVQKPRVLDFGCGTGYLVREARRQGHDFWGADTYAGGWAAWEKLLDPEVRPFISVIENARLPYPDEHFDVAVSNQVFEHVAWAGVEAAASEICRVLKQDAPLLSLFPTRDVWFEGHLGVYFAHRLGRGRRLQRAYLWLCHRTGFGYHRGEAGPSAWADGGQRALLTDVHYHRIHSIQRLWSNVFGAAPQCLATDYMRFRLARRTTLAPIARHRLLAPLLRFICHKRAGRVLLVSRRHPTGPPTIEAGSAAGSLWTEPNGTG